MKLLELTPKTFKHYRNNIKGNENMSYDEAKRKLTRNKILAYSPPSEGYDSQLYCFGKLHFLVNESGWVVWIKNGCPTPKGWKLDKDEYVRLNKELRIDGKSKFELYKKDVKYFFKINNSKLQHKIKKLFK